MSYIREADAIATSLMSIDKSLKRLVELYEMELENEGIRVRPDTPEEIQRREEVRKNYKPTF